MFLVILTAWSDFSLFFPLVPARMIFDLYSWTVFVGFLFGLACRPADSSIALFSGLFSRGTPILAGGIGIARAVVGAVGAIKSQ